MYMLSNVLPEPTDTSGTSGHQHGKTQQGDGAVLHPCWVFSGLGVLLQEGIHSKIQSSEKPQLQ